MYEGSVALSQMKWLFKIGRTVLFMVVLALLASMPADAYDTYGVDIPSQPVHLAQLVDSLSAGEALITQEAQSIPGHDYVCATNWTVYTYAFFDGWYGLIPHEVECQEPYPSLNNEWVEVDEVFCAPGTGFYFENFYASCSRLYAVYPPIPPARGTCTGSPSKQGCNQTDEPIDTSSRNENLVEVDYQSSDGRFKLTRSYNSDDTARSELSPGWHNNYSGRQIISSAAANYIYKGIELSGAYTDPASACAAVGGLYTGNMLCQVSGQTVPVLDLTNGVDYGDIPATPYAVAAQRADGSEVAYTCKGSPCTPNAPNTPQTLLYNTLNCKCYQFTDENDTVETYSFNNLNISITPDLLKSVTARGGYNQTITESSQGYGDGYGNGNVGTITDSFGRTLTFNYNPSNINQLTSVTTPDGTIQYGYDSQNRLSTVTWLDTNNNQVGYKQYQYNDSVHPYALTDIIDESQQEYATVAYDDSTSSGVGNAISSANGGLASNGGLGVWGSSINYSTAPADPADPIVTDARGISRTYHFTTINGQQKLTSISGAACNTCDGPQAESFDSAGYYSSQTDWNGNVTNFVYDDTRGLETQRTEAANDTSAHPVTRTIATSWETNFRLPHQISEYTGGAGSNGPSGVLQRQTTLQHDGSGNLVSKTVQDFTTPSHPTRTWSYSNYTSWGGRKRLPVRAATFQTPHKLPITPAQVPAVPAVAVWLQLVLQQAARSASLTP